MNWTNWWNRPGENTANLPGHYPSEPASSTFLASASGTFHSITSTFNYFIVKPITVVLVITLGLVGRMFSLIYFRDVHRSREGSTSYNNALMNDPIRSVEQFVLGLEENLLPQQQFSTFHSDHSVILPPFFQGSYTQALYMATHHAKFLFIYLTNSQNDGAQSVFQRIITNPRFIGIFTADTDHIIWGADLTNPEAYQLANSLNITKFPVLGLLCLARTTTMTPEGPKKTAPRISLILKIQGGLSDGVDADQLIQTKFIRRMMKYEPELAVIRSELRERYVADMMRRKQDSDYQASLLRDKQKKAEKQRKVLLDKYLRSRQPYIRALLDSSDRTDTAKIAIRMPDGSRMTTFFPKLAPVEDVFTLVELRNREMLESVDPISESDTRLLDGFHMDYPFRLTSTVPPRPCLNDVDRDTAIEQVEYIYPGGLLMVEATE